MSDEYGDKLNEMEAMVVDALPAGEKSMVFYSAYKTSKATDNPLNNLKQIAIRGKVVMVQAADDFWGDEKSEAYKSDVLDNPTWLDIAVRANKMIHTVRDAHHIFLEGVYPTGKKVDGVKTYEFSMGS
jgi:hypothetical protein